MEHALRQNSVNATWGTMAQTATTSRVKLLIHVLGTENVLDMTYVAVITPGQVVHVAFQIAVL